MGFCTQAQAGSGSLEMSSCDDCETAAMRRGEAGAMKPAAQHNADSIKVARSIVQRRRGLCARSLQAELAAENQRT